jgi:hypothetical protein
MFCAFCGSEIDSSDEDELMCASCRQSEINSLSLTDEDSDRIDQAKLKTPRLSRDERMEFYGECGFTLEDINYLEGDRS